MRTNESCDVLVAGGGVIGLCCALELLRAGRQVTLIDRGKVGEGASHGNCGTITPSHSAPLAMPGQIRQALAWMLKPDAPFHIRPRLDLDLARWLLHFAARCNRADFERGVKIKAPLLIAAHAHLAQLIARESLACGWESVGTLNVFRSEAAMAKSAWLPPLLREAGLVCEVLDGPAVRALEPALRPEIVGAFWHKTDSHLRPERYVAALVERVRAYGATIIEDQPIESIERAGGRVQSVRAADRSFAPREMVFALGAWSPLLGKALGLKLPIQPGKGYSMTFAAQAGAPRLPLTFKERQVCSTTWENGYRLGSTMEFAGFDARLNRVRLDALRRAAGEYLVHPPQGEPLEQWCGWRPMVYDDLPIIGRAPGIANLILATGHGMLGVTESALTGVLVRELVTGQTPSFDLGPLSPARFH